ncbi:hypothetical protein [Tenacibaculum singaporense]|uniref:Uncharacterized protein n=1 Tax=Tenacibaculum singaporense TaxID=2358479 RepID=A0A3Q8RMU3_9FLAO|nr:hypothetical protein [Tenacibaculum singaporense]AZJ35108.1 hypothetical protein D6T69_06065 [Tenacibaculum singaporense]
MKNRKNKISNLFKVGVFLFGISLFLWNCENEPLLETQSNFISKVKNRINTDLIDLPYTKNNLIVDWNNYNIITSDGLEFYEFKTELIAPLKNSSESFNSPSFYVIVYKENNAIIIKYIEVRAYNYSLENLPIDFINLGAYSGSFRYFNDKGELENSEAYIEGYLIKSNKDNYLPIERNTLNRAKEDGTFQAKVQPCTEVPSILYVHETTHHYQDYYKASYRVDSNGNMVEGSMTVADVPYKSVYLGSTTQTYTYTSYSCDTPHTGDEVYKSEYMREQILMDCGPGYDNVTYDGYCVDTEEQIINKLEGKAECVYNKLKNSSTSFKSMIQNFDGDFPVSHLKLTINNSLGFGVYGITLPPVNYVTEIQINGNGVSNLSDLGVATTIAHELIHAEIFRKMLSAAKKGDLNYHNNQNYTTQDRINYVNSLKDNFPGLYDYYWKRYKSTWNHNMMATHYRTTIADIIQSFDNNRLSRSTYESIAWAGLGEIENNQSTIAWQNLTSIEQQAIIDALNQYFFNGTSNCN